MLKLLLISNKLLVFVLLLPMGQWDIDDIINGNFFVQITQTCTVFASLYLHSLQKGHPVWWCLCFFFRLCFLRLAWGDGGGSSLGLVALLMPGAELRGSDIPLAGGKKTDMKFNQRWQTLKSLQSNSTNIFLLLFFLLAKLYQLYIHLIHMLLYYIIKLSLTGYNYKKKIQVTYKIKAHWKYVFFLYIKSLFCDFTKTNRESP